MDGEVQRSTVPLGARVARQVADLVKAEAAKRNVSVSTLIKQTLEEKFAQTLSKES